MKGMNDVKRLEPGCKDTLQRRHAPFQGQEGRALDQEAAIVRLEDGQAGRAAKVRAQGKTISNNVEGQRALSREYHAHTTTHTGC